MSYPTLRLGVLQGIAGLKARCDAEPGFLRKPDCPYDNDTIEMLEALFEPITVEVVKEVIVDRPATKKRGPKAKKAELGDDEMAEIEKEAKEILKELRQLAKTEAGEMKELDTATKLQIIKTRTTLIEKLVSVRERITSARKVSEFMQTVVGILDDLIEEDKRDEMVKRLEEFL
jgi:hypothetical protein